MSTFAEIESAIDGLQPLERRELLFRLAARVEKDHVLPEPRIFTKEQIREWIEQDEKDGIEIRKKLGL